MFELLLEPDPKLVLSLMNENTERTFNYPVRALYVNKPSAAIKRGASRNLFLSRTCINLLATG